MYYLPQLWSPLRHRILKQHWKYYYACVEANTQKHAINCNTWGAYIWQAALKFQYFGQKESTPYETDHLRVYDLSISSYSVSTYPKRIPQQVLISTLLYLLHDSWTSLLMNLKKISNKRQVAFLFPKSDQWMTITPRVTTHFVTNQFVYSHHFSLLDVRICIFWTSAINMSSVYSN